MVEKLIVTTNEYDGKYVALRSFEDYTVVGAGDDPQAALDDAKAKGFEDPVIVYIEPKDTVQIY
jgi:hypothetical protein